MRDSPRLSRVATVTPLLILGGSLLAQETAPLDIYTGDSAVRRRPATTAFPKYPEEARLYRLEGETTVCFRVNAQGEIVRPRVESSTHRIFERPALRAVRASAFEPLGVGEGDSVPDDVCRVFRFRLSPIAVPEPPPADSL